MAKIRLTMAQALVRFLAAQRNADGLPIFAGVWAIFGHGNVAGMGEALEAIGEDLPTYRGQNEQGTLGLGVNEPARQAMHAEALAAL